MLHTNGINMHITQAGEGPLVILLHGFPELGYSWRHQMDPIARAGYRVVAPDLRGYGKTDSPKNIDAYDMLKLTADVVGLVEALEETQAIIIGHDFGSALAQYCALLRPDIFRALALLSVPYTPRKWGNLLPTQAMKKMSGDAIYYINYFQEPDNIEKELEADVHNAMLKMFHTNAPQEGYSPLFFRKGQGFLDNIPMPDALPDWLTQKDMDVFTREFTRSGFTGPVNWYRNIDENFRLTPFLTGAKILQPTLFIEGEYDAVRQIYRSAHKLMKAYVPNLRDIISLPKTGHWIQQESPDEVNAAIIKFLQEL
ncbi:MAG: alpha/beta hydrolase [Proteobacteria bacterium]|nr:alpha/beta hydrolase [Pseudomonadota bacterium]MBU1387457.1 alpha/beta hydrolase [Pseudomonadota bacterium]MBU1541956.1 alpha/beta hydrolase [Pseudomonadota bacterium]MBU2430894.1 alpha/beta hydrolase [Pseudomonadota bacterium]MBU2479561.1 alpha/beta hydrolase [Pseudomonadota bacterium]